MKRAAAHAVVLDFGGDLAGKAGHFAGMRRQTRTASWQAKGLPHQGIGIQHDRVRELGDGAGYQGFDVGPRPRPGPMAITVLPSMRWSNSSSDAVISSGACDAITGMALAAEATVTSPAPARSAPSPAMAAGAGLIARPCHHQHVAEGSLMAGWRARRQQFVEHLRGE